MSNKIMQESLATIETPNQQNLAKKIKEGFDKGGLEALTKMMDKKSAHAFVQTAISLATSPTSLIKNCTPSSVIHSVMMAANTGLSIDPALGQCAIIPFKDRKNNCTVATYMIMKNGFLQLLHRTGTLKNLISEPVYKGDLIVYNRFKEEYVFDPLNTDKSEFVGWYCNIKLISGFEKSLYMTVDELVAHGKRYSQSFRNGYKSLWGDDDAKYFMYEKTVLKKIAKFLPLSPYEDNDMRLSLAMRFDQSTPTSIKVDEAEPEYIDAVDLTGQDISNIENQIKIAEDGE